MTKDVKIFIPKLRIVDLVQRAGGISRETALEQAAEKIEGLRESSLLGISEAVLGMERILGVDHPIGMSDMVWLLRHAERIVTLAETFGHVTLALVGKSLCDLTHRFLENEDGKREPLRVHADALRLVMPPRKVSQEEAGRILGELTRILVFCGCMPREESRLKALRDLELLDTGPDARLDRLLAKTQKEFSVPIAAISLVDLHRQWFKSSIGLDAKELPRGVAFCSYAIENDGVMVVEDAERDSRFASNPLVTGSPGVRFYAGAPLKTSDGFNIGTLCVIDAHPRTLDAAGLKKLEELAREIVKIVEADAASRPARFRQQALPTASKEVLGA
jgi:GAF domain-containing protein